ncbi:MAG: hypothetical protein H7255_08875 [Ramlibacter sp.]|nr:hypothetical protein [Ramlibacter sp.]
MTRSLLPILPEMHRVASLFVLRYLIRNCNPLAPFYPDMVIRANLLERRT